VKKKKAPPVIVVKKDKSNRISSDKDCMIELKEWTDSVIQQSAAVLCFSNYRESFINIASIDIKTRRKTVLKKFLLSNPPTKLFQVDADNILVGTEGGKIEHWNVGDSACAKIYDAHPESNAGIS